MALLTFLRRLFSVVYLMTHDAVPLRLKVLPVLAAVYVLLPRDLVFDFRPFGFVDDAIVGLILLGVFTSRASKHVRDDRERKSGSIPVEYEIKDREAGSDSAGGSEDRGNGARADEEPPSEDLRA